MKTTPLTNLHIEMKAKMNVFADYNVPMWFSSIQEEHAAVRNDVGMFDISHMGLFKITGEGAKKTLQKISSNNTDKARYGRMIYAMALNEDGGIQDDIMFGEINSKEWILVVNSSNKSKIAAMLNENKAENCKIEDLNETHAFIAVQGPKAAAAIESAFELFASRLGRFDIEYKKINQNVPIILSRTGYTGEDGFEMIVPKGNAEDIWKSLLEYDVTPCGFGARDTLRIEAGLPLYGHELSDKINPLMTRYRTWVVDWTADFIGKVALMSQKESCDIRTVGIVMEGKHIPRQDYLIKEGGVVTSGTKSISIGQGIGIAMVNKEIAKEGTEITVLIRNREHKATVVKLPFSIPVGGQ